MSPDGTFPTICRQCDMRCGIRVQIAGGRAVRITGLEAHPQNHGRLCPRAPPPSSWRITPKGCCAL